MAYHAEAYYRVGQADAPEVLSTPEEVDAFIDRLLAQPDSNNLAGMYLRERLRPEEKYPNHQFMVGVDATRMVGALKYINADGGWASFAPDDPQRPSGSYCLMHNETEFPPGADIPIALVRQAVKEFVAGGGQRPAGVQWQDDPTL